MLSLPLGIKRTGEMWDAMMQVRDRIRGLLAQAQQTALKTRLLLINNSGWGHRAAVNEMVSARFNHTVRNTFAKTEEENYWAIASSQFVLCPSGFGYDTYRLWETLLLGSIPIVESNEGFDRTFSRLPVLVVRSFSDLTPQFLHRAYNCFVSHADRFSYEHLSQRHWEGLIERAAQAGGSALHSLEVEHPKRNPYCNFLFETNSAIA